MLVRVYINGDPFTVLVENKWAQSLWKTIWLYLINLNIHINYDPAVLVLGMDSIEAIPLKHHEDKDKNFRNNIAHNGKTLVPKHPYSLGRKN